MFCMVKILGKRKNSILLVSRWSVPAKNPRAFRTTELIKELAGRQYELSAVLPDYAIKFCGIRTYHVAAPMYGINERNIVRKYSIQRVLMDIIRKLSVYFLGETPGNIIYSLRLIKVLRDILLTNSYDVVISISYPFYVNLAVAICRQLSNYKMLAIADCGDPFYDNPSCRKAPYLKWLEKKVLRCFDYVTIPLEAARKSYADYEIGNKLRIIPQGFAIPQVEDDVYSRNDVPVFCYAGVLYEKIRNPRYFFDYLMQVKQDFIFVVYALPDTFTLNLLGEYKKKLGKKMDIREPLSREELIYVMSQMEFVVNFDNENSNQKPSKLIDYAMSKRPILSFNSRTFNAEIFQEFLDGDYHNREQIDVSQYDIRIVADKFEALFAEK